jgi:hypothetical protein
MLQPSPRPITALKTRRCGDERRRHAALPQRTRLHDLGVFDVDLRIYIYWTLVQIEVICLEIFKQSFVGAFGRGVATFCQRARVCAAAAGEKRAR